MSSPIVLARTEADIERAITHRDLDYELARAGKYRWQVDPKTGVVSAVPSRGPGSFVTGTNAELLYASKAAYTNKNTFTTEFNIADTATGNALWTLQPGTLFQPGAMVGKKFRIIGTIRQLGTGSTPPTWLLTLRMNPTVTPAIPPTGPNVGAMVAALTGTTTANTLMRFELEATLTVEGAAGNNSTIRGVGMIWSPRGFASPFAQDLFGGGATPGTVATFDWSSVNTLTVGMTCGTSLAANEVQLLDLLAFGLN